MENEELQEEEIEVLYLTDEEGNEIQFECLDCVEYEGTEYLILLPADDDSTETVILEIDPVTENYYAVDDEDVLDAVFGIFKERYKDVFTFEN